MNRIEIKEKAKEMIKGNLWYILKPMVFFALICFACAFVAAMIDAAIDTPVFITIIDCIAGLIGSIVTVGYTYYCLEFVHGQKHEWTAVFTFAKEHWVISLLTGLLTGLIIAVGLILLVIPGLIAGIGLTFWAYVVADNPELSVTDAVKRAWDLTNGYKVDIFIFYLSFFGWLLLVPFTLGILAIWLVPYMTIAETILYDKMKATK